MSGRTLKTMPLSQRAILRLALVAGMSLGLSSVILPDETRADSDDRWYSKKRELTLQERRAQRKQFQDDFAAKLGPDYETNIPFASQQAIDGLKQAITR